MSLAIHNLDTSHLFDLRVDLVDVETDVGHVEKTKEKRV